MTVAEFAERYDERATGNEREEAQDEEYAACVAAVVEHAAPTSADTVLDLGTGTGTVAFELAESAGTVIGRDISDEMIEQARERADEQGIDNVEFGRGRLRAPNAPEVDIVVSNLALHHLPDPAKREAIEAIADLEPRRVVVGTSMFFEGPDAEIPEYDPEIVAPPTVADMVRWFTEAGFHISAIDQITDAGGVIAAERCKDG